MSRKIARGGKSIVCKGPEIIGTLNTIVAIYNLAVECYNTLYGPKSRSRRRRRKK